MIKRSKRMEPIKDLIELREKNAARRMAECQRVLAERETRLSELIHYRDSYIEQQADKGNVDPVRFQEYRLFLSRLNDAINEQKGLVEAGSKEYDDTHSQWSDSKSRTTAIEKAVDRYKASERIHENRQEQKQDDEVASSRHRPLNR